jgi:hypothetical protein
MKKGLFDPFAEPSAELIAEMAPAPTRRNRFKLEFCQFRIEALYQIAKETHNAELAVLTRLYELWFANFKKNPVRLNTRSFRKIGLSRLRVSTALDKLETSGQVAVERGAGKCHLVTLAKTLLWEK